MKKILFLGETWMKHIIHQKGFDIFTSTHYQEGHSKLKEILDKKYEVTYVPGHRVQYDFPKTQEELMTYDAVVISDVGSNSLLLSDAVFSEGKKELNKCKMIKEFVLAGKSLLMIGGYYSFSGIEGKARYGMTHINDVLPVDCLPYDDRVEAPEGVIPNILLPDSELLRGVSKSWPQFFGYNKTRIKKDAVLVAEFNDDPFLAYRYFGKGKSMAFTTDCSPHWGSNEFLNWESYDQLWYNIFDFLTE